MTNVSNKVSVIIPVYNSERYISRCLDSVIKQSYKNVEIIVVNDGSTDESKRIINEKEFNNKSLIKCIDKTNGGLASARNEGLKNASGEYVFFLDSDDCLKEDAIRTLTNELCKDDFDIVVGRYEYIYDYGTICYQRILKKSIIDTRKCDEFFLYFYYSLYGINACNKLYKKSFLEKAHIEFESNAEIYAEDLLFNYKLVINNPKIIVSSNVTYEYYQNTGSITHSYQENLDIRYSNLINNYYSFSGKNGFELFFLLCNAINCVAGQERNILFMKRALKAFKNNLSVTPQNKKYTQLIPLGYRLDYCINFFLFYKSVLLEAFYHRIKRGILRRRF